MYNAKAYSAASATSPLASTTIPRRDPTEHDVQIEILFCGICHSDLHTVRNEWSGVMPTVYPCVPGHEIVGRVTKVGSAVTKFKPGDLAGVGCLVDSDGTCPECQAGLEQFCPNADPHLQLPGQAPRRRHLRRLLRQHRRRRALRPARSRRTSISPGAAPLLCAGITTYSPHAPLGRHQGQEGRRRRPRRAGPHGREVRPCASEPTSSSSPPRPGKKEDALRLGADEVVVSRNADEMQKHAGSFDFILDAVSADHDINAYINLLAPRRQPHARRRAREAAGRRGLRPHLRAPQPLRLAHRRHRRDPGDARLLRHSTTSPPTSRSSRSRRSTRPTSECSSPT